MQELDPHWFYSSLAQSAASLAGVLGGLLGIRLQPQLIETVKQRAQLRSDSMLFLSSAAANVETARTQIDGTANSGDAETQERHADWVKAMPMYTRLAALDTIYALELSIYDIQEFAPDLRKDASPPPLEELLKTVKGIVGGNIRLRALGATGYSWAVLFILAAICIVGLLVPLYWLEAYEPSKTQLLSLFGLCVVALLLVIGVYVRKVDDAVRVKSLRGLAAEP